MGAHPTQKSFAEQKGYTMKIIPLNKYITPVILALFPILVWAHGDVSHAPEMIKNKKNSMQSSDMMKTVIYAKINKAYIVDIRPIFEKKCFDCHAELNNAPWYYKVPGVRQMMNKDIREAKEHVDMRKDFPFISHESPLDDLKSIKKIGKEGGMPPLRYILANWDARLTDAEKKKLIEWAGRSIELLQTKTVER